MNTAKFAQFSVPPHVPGGKEVALGPFNVPVELISLTGFDCPRCRQTVRRAGQAMPGLVARMMIYACGCGPAVGVWEDECAPTAITWQATIAMALAAGVGLVIFHGGKETPPGFSGAN